MSVICYNKRCDEGGENTLAASKPISKKDLPMTSFQYTSRQITNFWAKVDKSGGENVCWIWTGARNKDGYGNVKQDGHVRSAHRVAFDLANGYIPKDKLVLHTCDNPACVNPKHLFLGTDKDNAQDREYKGRHPHAKLTDSQIAMMYFLFKCGGLSADYLADFFNVTRGYVCFLMAKRSRRTKSYDW